MVLAKGIYEVKVVEAGSGRGPGHDITIIVQGKVARKAGSFGEKVFVFNLSVRVIYKLLRREERKEKYRRGKTELYL